MQIKTLEQLKEVKVNDTLFLINPFGMGDQKRVPLEEFTVKEIHQDLFKGRKVMESLGIDYMSDNYFGDMLSRCKYVFTSKGEAEIKLSKVRSGLHANTVEAHHSSCEREFKFFNRHHVV